MNKNRAEPYKAYGEEMKTRVKIKNVLVGLPILAATSALYTLPWQRAFQLLSSEACIGFDVLEVLMLSKLPKTSTIWLYESNSCLVK